METGSQITVAKDKTGTKDVGVATGVEADGAVAFLWKEGIGDRLL